MRLRRESAKRPVERPRHEPAPEVANVGFELLETVAQNKGYAITNVDSLGVIERFTFAEIRRETAQWAQLLREKGLQPGDRVVIVTGREWGWRCALLGAIRAGGVAVPCPASLPLREIGAVADDAGASLLVTLRPRPDLVELDGYVALTADDLDDVDPSHALQQPPHRTEARDIALILYAWRGLDLSGTMHTHASLLAQADAGDHWLGVGADERIWATADDGSGPSIWLLLAGWHRAASIVVVDLELDSEAKLELLDRLRPVAVWFSDDEYRLLGSAEVPPWVDLGSIRRVFVDTDETDGAAAFSAAFGAALVPVFTLDELGVVAGWPNGRESRADAKTAHPAPGVQLAVVGEDGTELPPGQIGDVVVRADAPTLFTGYAGREGRSRSAEWFRFGWRGALTSEGALRLEARAPSEVVPADASAEIPVPEVAEAPPSEEPVPVQEDKVEDGREANAAREQAEHQAAEARAAEERFQAEQAAIALAAAEADERLRVEAEEKRREEERQRDEQAARARAEQEVKEREKAEAEERRRVEEAERVEAARRATEEKQREEERQREEKAARARADQDAKEREKTEAEERRRAEEDAKTRARIAEAEAKQRAKDEKERERREAEAAKEQAKIDAAEAERRAKDEREREKREAVERAEREKAAAEAAKVQAKVDAAEAKQRAKDEKEREKREAVERAGREKAAAEAAKAQQKQAEIDAKQRAKDDKEREKREAVERAEREKAAAEAAKVQAKVDAAEAKQRAKDEKEREKREAVERAEREKAAAEAAKAQQKQDEVDAKQRAEEEKRRAKEREREEKEARRRAEQEAKEAARAERKPAFGRRRHEVDEPEPEPEHVPDVVARIQQYGMAAASTERPAEPPEQSDDE